MGGLFAFVCMCVCLCVCGLTFAVFEKLTNGCSVCNVSACLPGACLDNFLLCSIPAD